jgi:hypothetical protein
MGHGGKRPGSGKKKGSKASHTLEAQEAKKLLIAKFHEHLEPIVMKAIAQATKGDRFAREWLSDRAWGKATQPIGGDKDNPLVVNMTFTNDQLATIFTRRGSRSNTGGAG